MRGLLLTLAMSIAVLTSVSARAYDTLHYFKPERFCLVGKPTFHEIRCETEMDYSYNTKRAYAGCDFHQLVRRIEDGREFTILFKGYSVVDRLGPGVMGFDSMSNMTSLSVVAVQGAAITKAHKEIKTTVANYKICAE
jgi:hypothetical protein